VQVEDLALSLCHSFNLSVEWHLRNPEGKKNKHLYRGVQGRLKSVEKLKANTKCSHDRYMQLSSASQVTQLCVEPFDVNVVNAVPLVSR